MNRLQIHRVAFGLLLIGFGVLSLLGNLNFFDIQSWRAYWPAIFIALGLLHVAKRPSPRGAIWGLSWMVVGGIWIANNLGYIHLTGRDVWPAILIFLGLHVIARGLFPHRLESECERWRRRRHGLPPTENVRVEQVTHHAVLSGAAIKNDTQDFRGGELSAVMGALQLDLRQAAMTQAEAALKISAVMAGLEIRVPQDWTVIVRCNPILGGVEDKTVPSPQSEKRLVIEGDVVLAGVEIKN